MTSSVRSFLAAAAVLSFACGDGQQPPAAVSPPEPEATRTPRVDTGQGQPVDPGPPCESPGQPRALANGLVAPRFVAVDSRHVYWSVLSSTTGPRLETLWMMAKAGGEPQVVIRDVAALTSLAAHDGRAYWAVSGGKIFRTGEGSTGPSELVVSAAGYPFQIAVDRHGLFWVDSNGGTVSRAGLNGSGVTVIASGQRGPQALALDETHVYWMNNAWEHKVPAFSAMKAPIEGGPASSLTGDQSSALGLAVGAEHVYVTTATQLLRVGKDGAGLKVATSVDTVTSAPAIGGAPVYFGVSSPEGGSVMSQPTDGATPAPVATGLRLPVAIAADATGVYWIAANGALTHLCQ